MDLTERTGNPHRHPWELSRADMALRLLSANGKHTRYADVGSGDLYFAHRLRSLTDEAIYAVDVNYSRVNNGDQVIQCTDLKQVPAASIDHAILMDVLEHVEDDVGLLRDVGRILTPAGHVLITVPAHQILWSGHDEFLGHVRRYDRSQLVDAAGRAGFTPIESFYFYAIPCVLRGLRVLLARAGVRRIHETGVGRWRFATDHPMTSTVRSMLNVDFRLSRALGTGPLSGVGLSIALRCRRTSA